MKKVIIALAFVTGLIVTSCGSSESTETKVVDSTAIAIDTNSVPVLDTVKAAADTTK